MELEISTTHTLRQLQSSDAVDIFNTIDAQRQYLGQWLPFVADTQTLEDSILYVEDAINAPEGHFELIFTIRLKGAFAGLIGFKDTDVYNGKTELGYWLSKPFQKQGLATQSVRRLCDYAFFEMNLNRVQIKCAVGNTPSKRIPKKLGFQLEGVERDGEVLESGQFTDLEIYSMLKREW